MATMPHERTASELWFEEYLRRAGLSGWEEHQPDLGVARKPDYLVSSGSTQAVCEVKEFETTWIRDQFEKHPGLQSIDPHRWFNPVRMAVKDAAGQLKPLRERGLPLVVVLANPRGADVNLSLEGVLEALYGNLQYQVTLDRRTGEPLSEGMVYGGGGRLRGSHPYLSAVVLLYRRTNADDFWDERGAENRARFGDDRVAHIEFALKQREELTPPDGDYFYVKVISTVSAAEGDAVRLPDDFFNGPRDEYWAMGPDRSFSQLR